MPLVSIIIPTYNRAGLVVEAIGSVAQQTFSDWELIVVDDGSTDQTRTAVIGSFRRSGRPASCRYLYQSNRGPGSARNLGIGQAQGQLLAFLDSDDLWLPEKLKTQVEFLNNNPAVAAVYTNETWLRQGRLLDQKKRHRKFSGWIFGPCLDLCLISPSSILLRKPVLERIGLFDESLPACEDYDLWLRLTKDYPVYLIDRPLIIKRAISPDQLSRHYPLMDDFRVRALENIFQADLTAPQRQAVRQHLIWRLKLLAKGSLRRFRLRSAISYHRKLRTYLDHYDR